MTPDHDPGDLSTIRISNEEASGASFVLHVTSAAGARAVALPAECAWVLGRGAKAELRVDDPSISRRHARFSAARALFVEDLESVNGTRVGERLLQPGERRELHAGDRVTMGRVLCVVQRVRDDGQAVPPAREPGPPEPATRPEEDGLVLADPTMRDLLSLADRMAVGDINVLLLGETGVGKEVLARRIHARSRRAAGPFVGINCAAFAEGMIEAELFGHEKGAFTGATTARPGLLESAAGGTAFLDEVGELPAPLQAKLLRVLEERRLRRVGAVRTVALDARIVAATNRDLEREVAEKRFRADLYFRLNGISLEIPPLRSRPAEVAPAARHFVAEARRRLQIPGDGTITEPALARLQEHTWPGNLRELRNTMERAVLLAGEGPVGVEHLAPPRLGAPSTAPPPPSPRKPSSNPVYGPEERERVVEALEQCGGNQTRAAQKLGMARGSLIARMIAFGLRRPQA